MRAGSALTLVSPSSRQAATLAGVTYRSKPASEPSTAVADDAPLPEDDAEDEAAPDDDEAPDADDDATPLATAGLFAALPDDDDASPLATDDPVSAFLPPLP